MRSLSSVKVFWPDKDALEGHLKRYVASLLVREEVVDVYLCGSWAKGTHTVASDVDLLILINDRAGSATQKPRDRMPTYLPDSFPTSLDLFVYTVSEARQSPFVRQMLQTGTPFPHSAAEGADSRPGGKLS